MRNEVGNGVLGYTPSTLSLKQGNLLTIDNEKGLVVQSTAVNP